MKRALAILATAVLAACATKAPASPVPAQVASSQTQQPPAAGGVTFDVGPLDWKTSTSSIDSALANAPIALPSPAPSFTAHP